MRRLRDPQWQSPHLAAHGVAHVPWKPVLDSYASLAEAADVLGRADLAEAIESRATPELCRAYAPLLSVLRRVARDPLAQPPVSFPPEPKRRSDEEVWEEAMRDIASDLRPADFSSSDELAEDAGSWSSGGSDMASSNAKPEGSFSAAAPNLDVDEPRGPSLSPRNLSHADFIRELRLCLLGLSTLRPGSVLGMSSECHMSIWARFDVYAKKLAAIPPEVQRQARSEVVQWRPVTVLQLLVSAERLVQKYGRQSTPIDTSGIAMFLNGDPDSPAVVHERDSYAFSLSVPSVLRHPLILRAGETAVLAVRVHGVKFPPLTIKYDSQQQYIADIQRIYARNTELLITDDLKRRLSDCWRQLAGVFLAQDPRTLIFLSELVQNGLADGSSDRIEAQRILNVCWPRAPFVLADHLVPAITQNLDTELENVLGPGLEGVFPRERLANAWAEVVRAISEGDQLVELLMAELYTNVQRRIESAQTLEPFF